MKTFAIFLTLLFAFAGVAPDVEAKRLGGSKSFGKSYRTAPAYTAPAAPRSQPATAAAAAPGTRSPMGGMMGGMLGGLLAGGLLGALFAGGAFEGIKFLDILLIGAIGYLMFRLLRARSGGAIPAAAGHREAGPAPVPGAYRDLEPAPVMARGDAGRPVFDVPHIGRGPAGSLGHLPSVPVTSDTTGGFDEPPVPFNFPPGFEMNNFLAGAREHYRALQQAWNVNDFDTISEYLTPALQAELRAERATLDGEQHTEILYVDAEIVRADMHGITAELSVKFTGAYRDTVEGVESKFVDIWHLTKDTVMKGSPWFIEGIESGEAA